MPKTVETEPKSVCLLRLTRAKLTGVFHHFADCQKKQFAVDKS